MDALRSYLQQSKKKFPVYYEASMRSRTSPRWSCVLKKGRPYRRLADTMMTPGGPLRELCNTSND